MQIPPDRGLGDPPKRDIRDLAKAKRDSLQEAHFHESASGFADEHVSAKASPDIHRLKFVAIIGANLLGSNQELALQAGVSETYASNARNGRHVTADAAERLLEVGSRAIDERAQEHPLISQFGEFGLLLPGSFLEKPVQVQLSILERTLELGLPSWVLDRARQPLDDYLMNYCADSDDIGSANRALRITEALAVGEYG